MNAEILQGPFPPRKASQLLYERLAASLTAGQVPPGGAFLSDAHVVRVSGLSRTTVRRALDRLCREGWIERRAGVGSFIGPRATMGGPAARPSGAWATARPTIRVAVLIHLLGENAMPDWYSRGVLDGLDQAAIEAGIRIELIGNYASDILSLSKRLAQSRPDVLVVMPASSRHTMLAGEALSLGIPCLLAGSHITDAGLPTIGDDGTQGAALAVRHLAAHGHRRIGLLMCKTPAAWAHVRRDGFLQGLQACGLEADEQAVLWTPYVPPTDMGGETPPLLYTGLLEEYLNRVRPTALILGSSGQHSHTLGAAMKAGRLRVPKDLSLVCFDQNYAVYYRDLGLRPTVVALPLRETGQQLAVLARRVFEQQPVAREVAYLPCRLEEGESVGTCTGAGVTKTQGRKRSRP